MDVLLTHSNHLFYDSKQIQKMQPYPPLQTLLVASVLRASGLSVELCDVTFDSPAEKLRRMLESGKPPLVIVCEDDFNFITKMCLKHNREVAFRTAAIARRFGSKTAVHGSDSSDHVAEYLDAGFDTVLIGEVEETARELAGGHPLDSIAGLAYRPAGTGLIRYTGPRSLRTNLDALPLPAWDLVDIDQYRRAWRMGHGFFSLNMATSRGCPYRCNWCAKPIYGNNYHVRSPRSVAEEMLLLKERYRPDHIWFADDIFALSGRWTLEFSRAVEELNAQIPFKMQSRCDLMTRERVAALKRAGCCEIWMGAESGSQRILDAMDKGIRVADIYEARQNLRRYDIRAGWFLQFGYPTEDWNDIEATISMVRETKPDDIGVSVSYPLPGTKFYQLVSSQLGAKTNWSHSGDLAIMFQGTYPSELYRALSRALHLEVREPGSRFAIESAWKTVHRLKSQVECANEAVS